MPGTDSPGRPGLGRLAGRGAGAASLAVLAYTLAFLLYAFARSGLTLLATVNEAAGLPATLLATWISLSIAALAIALLVWPLAALVGAGTALLIGALCAAWNREHAPGRALAIGAGACAAPAALIALALAASAGPAWTSSLAETLGFWLGLPLLVYIAAGGLASLELNRRLVAVRA